MRTFRRPVAIAAVIAALLATNLAVSRGEFINNTVQIPVDRIVANVQAWIKDKPQDAQAYYVLGRIHAMAWAYGPNLNLWGPMPDGGGARVPAGRGGPAATASAPADPFNGQLPGFAPYDSVRVRRDANKKQVTEEDLQHLEQSINNYTRAIELDPKNAIYELGLAWILQQTGSHAAVKMVDYSLRTKDFGFTAEKKKAYEQAAKDLGNSDPKVREAATATLRDAMPLSLTIFRDCTTSDDPEVKARAEGIVKGYWDLRALDHYRKAYALRLDRDLQSPGGLMAGDTALAAEAGDAILEILKSQSQAATPNEIRDVSANVKTLRSKPMAITPVIFAMPDAPAARLGDLLDTSKRVSFDLAGDNVPRTWTWLKDGTALLVWDPAHTGAITNGRQLFGSRTWWVFFRDGYETLSLLDDNRDGQITGNELQGIAVWLDKNGDAVAQPGEVLTLEQAGISAISVRASHDPDGVLTSSAGITFTDGRTVKSFDWVASPVQADGTSGQ